MTASNPTTSTPPRRTWKTYLPMITGAAGFIAFMLLILWLTNTIGLDRIRDTVASAGAFAPLLYIALKMATYVFAPLSSGPIQLSAGVLFGIWQGTLYTLIGELLGGSISFFLARHLGRPVVRRFVGEAGMTRVEQFYTQTGEWRSLLFARIFLFSVYDFLSYAAGLTPIKYRIYLIVSAVGGVIPTFAAVALGSTLTEANGGLLILYAFIGLACVLPFLFQKRLRAWLKIGGVQMENLETETVESIER